MRISAFVAGFKATSIASFALALLGVLPAHGQGWDSMADPQQNSLGHSYCMLWQGDSRPMMQFTIRDDGAHFVVVAANEFSAVPQNGEATFRVPSGEIIILKYAVPQSGVILTSFTQSAFAQFLHHFERPGEFYISVDGKRVDFTATETAPMIATLWQCAAALE
ncbi:hypothetical protein [Paracoccus sp. SSJ]|uniref:hypothetical protein n=1 Tax=Paracoccus sp. SSJ TaxID=3050636 RepID=UPI00254E615E|nr:hypothetical protein [Paracoccus sp. SSJ]MDK8874221.1 hypothetical protein [Paracoccus sp. SSJ]